MKWLVLIFILGIALQGVGQTIDTTIYLWENKDCCWFGIKPNTELDSLMIRKLNIDTIKVYLIEDTWDSLPTKKLAKTFNVSNCTAKNCHEVIEVKKTSNKIKEIIQVSYGTDWNNKEGITFQVKLTHLIDSKGRITKTELKHGGGPKMEDWAFDEILYEYDGDLVVNAKYYGGWMEADLPYIVINYEYK